MLKGKKIVLGVTAGIAAYKAAFLVRLLMKQGAEVRVVMTPEATNFITPLTLATLSKAEVLVSQVADYQSGMWNNHVELGIWADLMLIAPATANTMAKMVQGRADNLLLLVYLSARCPVMLAPAMDLDMYGHPAMRNNLTELKKRGHIVLPSESGELASGLVGEGRMMEPEHILEKVGEFFKRQKTLAGTKWLVTAGPTYEAIDPVRFIGNHSSGKMGAAIALEAASRGAEVTLVAGPGTPETPHPAIERVNVVSATDMFAAADKAFSSAGVAVMAAAVADYTPVKVANEKIKKSSDELIVKLRKTTDILKTLGAKKKPGQVLVGFALETQNERANAVKKLETKNADMIVLNSLNDEGAGFGVDTNKITLVFGRNKWLEFELKSKTEVAADIVDAVVGKLKDKV